MLCNTGRKARYYLKIFIKILPLLSDLNTMTRFEIKARLPEGTYVDNHPELEHDFQYVWDAILAMWEGLEWIHLPVTHIQQSMERVIQFVTSTQVPKMIRCFNVDHGKKLDEHSKNFAAMTYASFGYVSRRSNFAFAHTYDRQPDRHETLPYTIDWFVYSVWCHHFGTNDLHENVYRFLCGDQYLKLYHNRILISPIRQQGIHVRMRLTLCEWRERTEEENDFYYEFCLFGGYIVRLTRHSYALFGNKQNGHIIFIKQTRAGIPLSPEDGGYPDEVNQYDPNPHGTDEDEIEEIILTKLITRDRSGNWRAKFTSGGRAAGGKSVKAVAKRILQLANDDDRYVDWRELLADKPVGQQDEEDLPRERIIRDNELVLGLELEMNAILNIVEFSQLPRGKGRGQWCARFLNRGVAARGNTKPDVAKKIIAMAKIINRTTGEFDVRYVEWRKYIKTHKLPHRHTSPISGMVESAEDGAVGVEAIHKKMQWRC
jgi:hypothetical protein